MPVKEEVLKTVGALKDSGFTPLDVIFEGAISVKGGKTLDALDEAVAERAISGVIRIVYTAGANTIRFVEIPLGELPQQQQKEGKS